MRFLSSLRSAGRLRGGRHVLQDLDYSCGAASLATVLNEYYGQTVTEADLLRVFEDMQRALFPFGFRAVGVSTSYEQLAQLKMPVVVYLEHRQGGHFSVLRGVDHKTVWLADPSLGNRTYSRSQFLAMWETRTKEDENAALKGRILGVLPVGSAPERRPGPADFFTKTPRRQTALAVERLEFSPILGLGPPSLRALATIASP